MQDLVHMFIVAANKAALNACDDVSCQFSVSLPENVTDSMNVSVMLCLNPAALKLLEMNSLLNSEFI